MKYIGFPHPSFPLAVIVKMRNTLILTLLILTVNLYGQGYSSLIPDSTILNFMNWEIENSGISYWPAKKEHQKKIFYKVYNWSESEFVKLDSATLSKRGITDYFNNYLFDENLESFIGPILKSSDIEFIINQYHAITENAIWDFGDNKVQIRKNTFRLSKKVTYFYSIPVFNRDQDIVFVKKMVYCGKLCAEHAVYIYKKKENGDWEMIHFTNYWVS